MARRGTQICFWLSEVISGLTKRSFWIQSEVHGGQCVSHLVGGVPSKSFWPMALLPATEGELSCSAGKSCSSHVYVFHFLFCISALGRLDFAELAELLRFV